MNTWTCLNLPCGVVNRFDDDRCFNCGYECGYVDPVIERLLNEARLDEARHCYGLIDKDVPTSVRAVLDRIGAIKQEIERHATKRI